MTHFSNKATIVTFENPGKMAEREAFTHKMMNRKWVACGLCHGFGRIKSYEDEWDCYCCEGEGGFWSE